MFETEPLKLNLKLNQLGINPENMKLLAKALKINKTIKFFNLKRNNLDYFADKKEHLAEVLKVNNSIQ